jgi:F-type H+-transporting ATPase subunit a
VSKTRKILYSLLGVYVVGIVVFVAIFGLHGHKNEQFKVIDAYKLETWAHIAGPLVFNKGVLFVILAGLLTVGTMVYAARKLTDRPGLLQAAAEWVFELTSRFTNDSIPDERLAARWFPLIATLFLFILFNNLLGYIPLPIDTSEHHYLNIFGLKVPPFQIYAADTNIALPLLLALGVFIAYNFEGVRHHGPIGYLKSLIPKGVRGPMLILIFPLELISNFLRLISLTVRLWANLLAGHMLIDFMAGALAVLLGLQVLGWFTLPFGVLIFMFEAALIAGLQAFIFAVLTAIYLGGAVESH